MFAARHLSVCAALLLAVSAMPYARCMTESEPSVLPSSSSGARVEGPSPERVERPSSSFHVDLAERTRSPESMRLLVNGNDPSLGREYIGTADTKDSEKTSVIGVSAPNGLYFLVVGDEADREKLSEDQWQEAAMLLQALSAKLRSDRRAHELENIEIE